MSGCLSLVFVYSTTREGGGSRGCRVEVDAVVKRVR